MLDIALHILGAAIMMVPTGLSSTPLWLAFPWAFFVALFWFLREWGQKGTLKGWGTQKIIEAAAPAVTALACAIGITVWRLT